MKRDRLIPADWYQQKITALRHQLLCSTSANESHAVLLQLNAWRKLACSV
jgi:hypothetical protein